MARREFEEMSRIGSTIMKVITDISMEEQYTPKGTKQVLKVEDVELSQIRPWDLYALSVLYKRGMTALDAVTIADSMIKFRKERYPQDE